MFVRTALRRPCLFHVQTRFNFTSSSYFSTQSNQTLEDLAVQIQAQHQHISVIVPSESHKTRLDKFLKQATTSTVFQDKLKEAELNKFGEYLRDLSRTQLQRFVADGNILVEDAPLIA